MPSSRSLKKAKTILLLDSDKVALASGAFFALVVMVLSLFYAEVDGLEVAFRVGLTFLVAYATTFVLVRYVQRTAGPELRARPPRPAPPPAREASGEQSPGVTPGSGEST